MSMLMSNTNICKHCAVTCAIDGFRLSEELEVCCVLECVLEWLALYIFHHIRALESSSPLGSSFEYSMMSR